MNWDLVLPILGPVLLGMGAQALVTWRAQAKLAAEVSALKESTQKGLDTVASAAAAEAKIQLLEHCRAEQRDCPARQLVARGTNPKIPIYVPDEG